MKGESTMLIVGINLNTLGDRYIAYLKYDSDLLRNECNTVAVHMKENYDEVYLIDIDAAHEDFISYIVLHGCRM